MRSIRRESSSSSLTKVVSDEFISGVAMRRWVEVVTWPCRVLRVVDVFKMTFTCNDRKLLKALIVRQQPRTSPRDSNTHGYTRLTFWLADKKSKDSRTFILSIFALCREHCCAVGVNHSSHTGLYYRQRWSRACVWPSSVSIYWPMSNKCPSDFGNESISTAKSQPFMWLCQNAADTEFIVSTGERKIVAKSDESRHDGWHGYRLHDTNT